jgi:hypothetical protein
MMEAVMICGSFPKLREEGDLVSISKRGMRLLKLDAEVVETLTELDTGYKTERQSGDCVVVQIGKGTLTLWACT